MMTKIPTLRLAALFAALCLTATSCNKEEEPEERIGARPEYVETHEALAAQVIALSNRFVDTMLSARSEEAARAAVAKLDDIAQDYESLAYRMEKVGLPDEGEREKIQQMIADNERFVAAKMESFITVMLGDQKIGEALQEGMEAFSKRIDRLTVFEEWAGSASQAETPKKSEGVADAPSTGTAEEN